MEQGIVWLDGRVSLLKEAKIPVTDRGFLFGHAIFETILAIEGAVVLWAAHRDRLRAGAGKARLFCPSEAALRHAVAEALSEFELQFGKQASERVSVRLVLTGGDSMTLVPQRDAKGNLCEGRLLVICRSASTGGSSELEKGFALRTAPDARAKELVDVKSNSYLWNLMCLDNARIDGFDDALFYNPDGEISESTTASFVWMRKSDKALCSAPQSRNVLPGTTLLCLQTAMESVGQTFIWQALHKDNYQDAEACAVLSSVRGLVPVSKIDDFEFDSTLMKQQFSKWNAALVAEQFKHRGFPPM
ncbi:MAG: hypothetical protein RIR26_99 [Pseudomonadota bacterium]